MARINDAHFDVYLKEIRETPLLTAEEELELARRIQAGDMQARERMIKANLRLVVSVAKEFLNRGLPYMDLIAEGNIGLMRGIEKFDPAQGNRFSTYGVHWIKQSIRRALVNSAKTVRIPSYMVELISEFKQKAAEMASRNGGNAPELHEVATEIGLTEDQFDMLRSALNSNTQSSDVPSNQGNQSISEKLPDTRSEDPAEKVMTENEVQMLAGMLSAVDERESKILRMRYGIGMDHPMTLSEIGDQLGLTRERIRQIENDAIRTLQEVMMRRRGYREDD
ncbi:MAG: sigma-70 family RNA polymerase sigma factor [Planctomycetes bacterium]|nr:sigma-70 family RNA polymerase sigma factor [Planctomycetota bacterium]